MFEFKIDREGDSATLHFVGNLSVKDTAKVKSELILLRDSGIKKLVFDFAKLEYLDSSGIGVLLHAYTWTKEKQGTIRIINMSKEVRPIFMISNLIDIFNVE
jgi:anti-anti-sigma factor